MFGILWRSAFAILAFHSGLNAADPPAVTEKYLDPIREGTRQLGRDVDQLQDALICDAFNPKECGAYRKVDALREQIYAFKSSLKENATREQIYERFDKLDDKVTSLLEEVNDLGVERRMMNHVTRYVRASSDQLQYAVFADDTKNGRRGSLISRQAGALADAATDLKRRAAFAIDDTPARTELMANLVAFQKAADEFAADAKKRGAKASTDLFKPVDQAWRKVVLGVKQLKPAEVAAFGRAAGRVDQLLDRLYRLTGVNGDRPRLIIRT